MKKARYLSVLILVFTFFLLSCSKEKQYQSKLLGTWNIYKVENTKNYYDIDSIVPISSSVDYGIIKFTDNETSVPYQTMDVAYAGSLITNNGGTVQTFAYELFKGYVMMHGGLVELRELHFEFGDKDEMTLVIGQNYNPGGTVAFALQTTYYFKK